MFSASLRAAAIAKGLFGGEFIFSRMNFFEKLIVKNINDTTEDVASLDQEAIQEFANSFNRKNKLLPI